MSTGSGITSSGRNLARSYSSDRGVRYAPPQEARGQLAYPQEDYADESVENSDEDSEESSDEEIQDTGKRLNGDSRD